MVYCRNQQEKSKRAISPILDKMSTSPYSVLRDHRDREKRLGPVQDEKGRKTHPNNETSLVSFSRHLPQKGTPEKLSLR